MQTKKRTPWEPPKRVGVIGHGSIGAHVAREIHAGAVPGASLECLVEVKPIKDPPVEQVEIDEAIARCDLLVECAGQPMVRAHAVDVLSAGVDLLITSVGAVAHADTAETLAEAGPGRLFFTNGAVGGIDLLTAAARSGGLEKVTVATTKLPGALVQPWMDEETSTRIRTATRPVAVFDGSAKEASTLFPRSLNVAATVAMAVGDWEAVTVRLTADPAATLTSHVIEAGGSVGQYRFEIRNDPSPTNPRTSRIVPHAVLGSLATAVGASGGLV